MAQSILPCWEGSPINQKQFDCLGVVLAGGLSSRMGKDKSLLTRKKNSANLDVNMLDFSKQLLVDAGIANVVVSGDNQQIPDRIAQAGPVGGIYSVLASYPKHLQPKSLLILPVDLPLMTANAIKSLKLKGELSQQATMFKDSQNKVHHIPLYLPNNAFLTLFLTQTFQGDMLATPDKSNGKNGPSVKGMLKQIPHQVIASPNNHLLFNTNTPQEWQQASQQF
ncbi:molybdenum cofactor guanylyltransferase [Colwelliaceae bacterium MEBiC 14330]